MCLITTSSNNINEWFVSLGPFTQSFLSFVTIFQHHMIHIHEIWLADKMLDSAFRERHAVFRFDRDRPFLERATSERISIFDISFLHVYAIRPPLFIYVIS